MKKEARIFFDEKLRKLGEGDGSLAKRQFSLPDMAGLSAKIKAGHINKVHLTGVCGTAMSSLAGLFATSGFEVSGSDTSCYPPTSDLIKRLNIRFYEGFDPKNLENKDLIVVANMFGPDNPEAAFARDNNLPELSMPEAIAEFFIQDRTSIVIAGTHGKTTTTGLAAHVFLSARRNPGFVVGGVAVPTKNGIDETSFNAGNFSEGQNAENAGSNKNSGNKKTEHFIIEGDEYDTSYFDKSPKFLHYRPKVAVITSLEFDHVDIYKDMDEYRKSFIFLAGEVPKDGLLVLNGDSDEVRSLGKYAAANGVNVLYYGFNGQTIEGETEVNKDTHITDISAKNISTNEQGQHFNLIYKGQDIGQFSIQLFGRYNLANALAVAAVALHENISAEELREGLATFLGMKRRQEIRANVSGIIVIDDFAHHPTAVRETLSGIRERFPAKRIIVLFEPRSNTSRRKTFENEYGTAFADADALYLSMPALRHNDSPEEFIDGNTVITSAKTIKTAQNKDFSAFCIGNGDEALVKLVPELKSGDVVVIMSNGSFDGVHEKLIERLHN